MPKNIEKQCGRCKTKLTPSFDIVCLNCNLLVCFNCYSESISHPEGLAYKKITDTLTDEQIDALGSICLACIVGDL